MAAYDIVAQENDSWDHFNTGWMWIRSMSETVAAWQAVLDRDMVKTSRDQNNFNEVRSSSFLVQGSATDVCAQVLGTAELRLWPDPEQRPLRDEFVSSEGVRVKILPDDLFWSYHFERDRVSAERGNSVVRAFLSRSLPLLTPTAQYLHLTCGDDMATKVFLTRSLVRPSLLSRPSLTPNRDSGPTSTRTTPPHPVSSPPPLSPAPPLPTRVSSPSSSPPPTTSTALSKLPLKPSSPRSPTIAQKQGRAGKRTRSLGCRGWRREREGLGKRGTGSERC